MKDSVTTNKIEHKSKEITQAFNITPTKAQLSTFVNQNILVIGSYSIPWLPSALDIAVSDSSVQH